MAPPQSKTAKKPTKAGLTGEALLFVDEVLEAFSAAALACPRLVTLAWYFAIEKEENNTMS